MIAINDIYCFTSNDTHDNEINQCFGYDWNRNTILNIIRIHINHRIPNQFFLQIIFKADIIICMNNIQNDINNHIGYTQSNFVRALLSVSARIANTLSVGVQMIESHNVIKIQNIINELAIEKNSISTQIFLFSVLFILEKNTQKQIRVAISNHTKWKLKFWGLNIVRRLEDDLGMKLPVSSKYAT